MTPVMRRWAASLAGAALAVTALAGISGCGTLGYYWQSTAGHVRLLNASEPVSEVLARPELSADLRARLLFSQSIRDYAIRRLHLPDNASYRRYADLGRPAAVWNVVAAPELSLDLHTWCFLVVGCVGYRGYYDPLQARAEADLLKAQGLETFVYGVPAYSTLGKVPQRGWLADPLLNTFVTRYSELELARLIIHELSHQLAFAEGDTVFNESYATAVERIGSRLWLAEEASPELRERIERAEAAAEARRADFRRLAMATRERLLALYRSPASEADKRAGKAEALAELRTGYAALKAEPDGPWHGFAGYDEWFASVNNAQLGVLAAYNAQVSDFERLYERVGRDWPAFYAEVRRLAALPKAQRDAELARGTAGAPGTPEASLSR
ncbi:aminopeptidase [Leptothrix discophora]|uniref:Aminopeptidase n=1 Tax=Leptothrix discophora TaxID=89 RepID=A0ABT9G646_LEPDI|nr:aminopeptidase [Leptothrix discophora]MDP4301960.1 aminopeptidase [Leptothrix discophora]